MPSLLHISDLHRTAGPRLSNDELLTAIVGDAKRWEQDEIPWPDIVVVSGDLIRGAGIEDPAADSDIAAQYGEARDFLQRLADEIVESDHSRVVIVPGNHDVHWSLARNSMQLLNACPNGIESEAFRASSGVRWDWKEQKAYNVVDGALYDSRLDHFRRFQTDFYAGLDPSPLGHGDDDLVFFEYPSLGLAVVGFASWYGNDCFCHVGEIEPKALALSQKLLANSNAPVAVAVWHHSIEGMPREHDYMDQSVIHKLIDFGFSVGLHGHQHRPGAAPYELRLPNLTSMVVLGAGSLAVGDRQLPMGEPRQFNLVVIDQDSESIRVHVRAMSTGGIFTGSYRDDFGGNTFLELSLPPLPRRPKPHSAIQRLDEAMTAVAEKRFENALALSCRCRYSPSTEATTNQNRGHERSRAVGGADSPSRPTTERGRGCQVNCPASRRLSIRRCPSTT